MKKIEDFIQKNEPQKRVSKLKKHESDILILYQKKYQIAQIQAFLKENKIKISERAIYYFLKNLKNKPKELKKELSHESATDTTEKVSASKAAQMMLDKYNIQK